MPTFRVSNLAVRVEDQALPKGVVQAAGKLPIGPGTEPFTLMSSSDSSGGPGCGCSCSCSCTCTCTCTCTSTSGGGGARLEAVELSVLKESVRHALATVDDIQKTRAAEGDGG